MLFFDVNAIWMVPLYPLIAFFLILTIRTLFKETPLGNKHVAMWLTVGATFLGLLHAIGALGWLFDKSHAHLIEKNFSWLHFGGLNLSIGYLLDSMSVMMLFVVTFISMFIQVYTRGYMDHDDGYCKFYAYLALFNFSMLGLVLSTNLFQMYIFWELVGVSSYLLIGFWFTKPSAAAAAVKAFLMNRVGDFGFLIGILGFLFYSWSLWQGYLIDHPGSALLSFTALSEIAPKTLDAAGYGVFTWICILILMGPMAKSAQVPLHTWLPDAMEGPTPISALIHAATMVAAGIYLVGRVYPIFHLSGSAMAVITLIGVLTALIGATIALNQTDIKKALAYSTMSQLGFMMTAMGVGAFTAGLFHLFTHAFFKALLFLCSGSVIHACEDEQDMRQMGGLFSKLPVTGWAYLIGTVAISGLPLTSGYFSKDMILEGAQQYHPLVFITLAMIAGMTAFYMFRTFFMTFMGSYRGHAHVHHENSWMTLPLMVLAVPSLVIGFLLSGFAGDLFPAFGDYIRFGHAHAEHTHTLLQMMTGNIAMTSTIAAFAGLALAWFFYATPQGQSWPGKITNAPILKDWNLMFSRKWYFDDIYTGFVDKVYLAFAKLSAKFDRTAIDGMVNWTGSSVMSSGRSIGLLQSGRLQTYITVLFFGVLVLSLLMYYGFLK